MAKALADKKTNELHKELADKRRQLQQFRFGASGSRARNPKAGRQLRQEIARILTELNARGKQQ